MLGLVGELFNLDELHELQLGDAGCGVLSDLVVELGGELDHAVGLGHKVFVALEIHGGESFALLFGGLGEGVELIGGAVCLRWRRRAAGFASGVLLNGVLLGCDGDGGKSEDDGGQEGKAQAFLSPLISGRWLRAVCHGGAFQRCRDKAKGAGPGQWAQDSVILCWTW